MINYPRNIALSGYTIYEEIDSNNPNLYIPTHILQNILGCGLIGMSVKGLAARPRSKAVKTRICQILGYPVPSSFKKTQPRFPGQNLDVYVQKSSNLQIWNEPIDGSRRYAVVHINENDIIDNVKVIHGDELAMLDRTGTLTQKYQARMSRYPQSFSSICDTCSVNSWRLPQHASLARIDPNSAPQRDQLLGIQEIFQSLQPLIGMELDYLGSVQERNRGAELHKLVCRQLGYSSYNDNGAFPDIANQLLEVKLQTSPTIDLGLYSPEEETQVVVSNGYTFCCKDIRYAIFDGIPFENKIRLDNLYLVTGEDFPNYFPLMSGGRPNKKIQLPLSPTFFS